MDEKQIAAIGPEDFVLGFQLAGVDEARATTPETYEDEVQTLLEEDHVGIIVARQEDVDALPTRLGQRVSASVDPVVIRLGGGAGAGLRDKIRSAIGIDLMRE